MNKIALKLMDLCKPLYPTFFDPPPNPPYPHVTIQMDHFLFSVPCHKMVARATVKVWSRYRGLQEILRLQREIERRILAYREGGVKITKSFLVLEKDHLTHGYVFHIKVRDTLDD